jgi:hypothetical protein
LIRGLGPRRRAQGDEKDKEKPHAAVGVRISLCCRFVIT